MARLCQWVSGGGAIGYDLGITIIAVFPMSIATPIASELIFLVEEDPEGGYLARAIGESIFTQADTLEELRQSVRDAVNCHFDDDDGLQPTGGHRPALIRLHIVRDEVIAA